MTATRSMLGRPQVAEHLKAEREAGTPMTPALWVLAIALVATVGTIVIDASLGRIEGWLVAFLVWLFAIPSDVDDRPARHPRVRAHLLSQLRRPRTPRRPD